MGWDRRIRSYPEQVKRFWSIIAEHTGQPELVGFAADIIADNNIAEKDVHSLARFLQRFVQEDIKFFRERPERWQSPLRTLQWKIGDCDDQVILLLTILRSFRVPVRAEFTRFIDPKTGKRKSHVHGQAYLPVEGVRGPHEWVSLETVRPVPLGFSPTQAMREQGIKIIGVDHIGDKAA